jgi:hypothetical protein
MRKHKLDVCCFLETKLVSSKVSSMRQFRLNNWKVLSNAAAASTARIVVFWNPTTVTIDLLDFSAQGLHVLISSLVHQFKFYASFVYGFNTIIARRALWDDLRNWSPNSPWLILGDFNSLLSQSDKHRGELVSTYETSDFRQCCSDLGLSDLNYSGSHFTWSNGSVWSKLDRVLANPPWSLSNTSVQVHFDNPGAFSDHSPATISFNPHQPMGKKCFKFFNMWSNHSRFLDLVTEAWQLVIPGSPMFTLCKRLKHLKRPLRDLNKNHFSHISERVARAEAALDEHQGLLSSDMENSNLQAIDKQLRQSLLHIKECERQFFSQKLKSNFLKDCDSGTSFFHSLMSRQHRQNFIPAIQRMDGSLTSSSAEVGAAFVDYYCHLLATPKVTAPIEVDVIQQGPCIDAASHACLLAPVSDLDIKNALFDIDDGKAPGPDGFSSCFFKKSWSVIHEDFCLAVRDFFQSGAMLKQINHSIIALIPKSAHTSSASDFRPISCCNVIYKVIAKLLATRLSQALVPIISPMQNAFLGGRLMSDNIHLLQELLRNYERKRTSPRCLMKIDFKKAFDSVQWPFLRQLLLLLGFPNRFVHLIMQCVETASYSVAVNGSIYGFFPGKNGVRQGDPLSPYLFLVCMEYFSRMLRKASLSPGFRFHPKCDSLGVCHLAFADDVILLSRGDRPSVSCLFQQLVSFGEISGLNINASKSSIYFGGVSDSIRHSILAETGFAEGSFPFRYLGVPLSPHRLLASQFSPLLQKLESAIHGWLGKNLSYAGRAELLKSVLYGMVQFWLNIFPLPELVIKRITSICRNFFWTGNTLQSKSALVNWHTICLPKSEGGLGFFDIKARNNSFLAKLIWNIHLKSDSIWIKWVHHYYLQSSSIWNITAHPSSSPLWKSTILFRNKLYDLCGGHPQSLSLMALWNTSTGPFSSNAYDYLRFRSSQVHWRRVIWEPWSLPRFSFILWLAILGRLRTRDRLHFLQTDSTCIFCHVDDESHSHLFFGCQWTSLLWNRVKHWLHITRNMSTLDKAVRGLCKSGSGAAGRMKRVSLAITVYIIWEERNKRIFDGSCSTIAALFRNFQTRFYTILHFHEDDHFSFQLG